MMKKLQTPTLRQVRHGKASVSAIAFLLAGLAAPAHAQTASQAAGDDIVVTATRSGDPIPAELIGSSVTVVSDTDLVDRQTRIVSDVLRDVPGVAVNRSGAVGDLTDVRIRGSEANQVLVFIDGIKADDPYVSSFNFGTLITDEAARIEVLRGQQSSLYGSDAIGGVISYTTLSGRELPGVSLRAEGGSMGTYDGGARVGGVAGNADYALSSSYYHTDGYPVAPGGRDDVGSNTLGVTGKVNWTPAPDFKITAVGRYSYARADSDDQAIAANSPVIQGYPLAIAVDTLGSYGIDRGWYGLLGAEWKLGRAITSSLNATITDTTARGLDTGAYGGPYGDHGRRYRGSFTSTARFGDEHLKNRFTFAVDAERQSFQSTSPYANNDRHRIDTLGFVSQYDLTLDDRLAISASARIDANSQFADDATYRATASYLFAGGTRLHAAYGTGVKDPSATDLYDYSSGQFVGNPHLKPERSKGWEAGVEQSLMAQHARIGATWFDNRYSNAIDTTYTLVGDDYLQTPYNDPVRFHQKGLESYATWHGGDWRFDLAYTWLHAPQTIQAITGMASADGSPVPVTIQAARRPKNIASANATWAPHRLPLTATLTVRYNGRQNDYAFNADYNRLIVPLKAYTLVNVALRYELSRNVELFGRVENLGNDHYQEVFGYQAAGRAAYGGVQLKL